MEYTDGSVDEAGFHRRFAASRATFRASSAAAASFGTSCTKMTDVRSRCYRLSEILRAGKRTNREQFFERSSAFFVVLLSLCR
jgi:hypothetical protein